MSFKHGSCHPHLWCITSCSSTELSCARFLGLLHMEVFHQRLEQEHGASVISTAPTVPYTLDLPGDTRLEIESPSQARRTCLRHRWFVYIVGMQGLGHL